MAYDLFKKRDGITPAYQIDENTIDSTSTSINFVGKRKLNYGQPQNQNFLWMLENFSDFTPPSNAVQGQLWYNLNDNKLYVCTNENTQLFEKVNKPLVSTTAPNLSLSIGDTWFNPTTKKLYAWDGTTWNLIGPQSTVPLTIQEDFYLNAITTGSTASEMWVNGVGSSRIVVPNNTSYTFEIDVVARRTNGGSEFASFKFCGCIDNTLNNVTIPNGSEKNILSMTSGSNFIANVVADNLNKSLSISITGEVGKNITWNGVARIVKVFN